MRLMSRKITKEQYERGTKNYGYLTKDDADLVFTDAERLGYGVYGARVETDGDDYYVSFWLGDSCD